MMMSVISVITSTIGCLSGKPRCPGGTQPGIARSGGSEPQRGGPSSKQLVDEGLEEVEHAIEQLDQGLHGRLLC